MMTENVQALVTYRLEQADESISETLIIYNQFSMPLTIPV